MADEIVVAFADTFGNYEIPALPASGVRQVRKAEARALGTVIQTEINTIRAGQIGGLVIEKTWPALAARTVGPNGDPLVGGVGAEITGDAGTHTDPVVGGTVSNSGRFRYSTSPAGWERIGSAAGEDNRLAAEAAAADAEAAALSAETTTVTGLDTLGRAGLYGLTDLEVASEFAISGKELAFSEELFRAGLDTGTDPNDVTGWTFTRAAAAVAPDADGLLVSFASGAPRITDAGLTIQPARTNLFLQSNSFGNAAWSKNHCAITAAATTGPDGASSASLFAATGTGLSALYQSVTLTAADYTETIYAKANGTQRWLWVNYQAKGFDNTAWFDLQEGVLGLATGDSVRSIEPAAFGFKRCRFTRPATAGSRQIVYGFSPTEGVQAAQPAGQGIYIAFAQVELGSGATSPITTTATTVARPADVATFAFTPAASGYLYIEFVQPRVQNTFTVTPISSNVGSPVSISNGAFSTGNGVQNLASGGSASEGELVKGVLTWDATGRRFYTNGVGASDANGVGAITSLSLGNTDGALNSRILSLVAVNNVALSTDDCIVMTGGAVSPSEDLGPTTFEAPALATKAVMANFDSVEKAYLGQQGVSDFRPASGVIAAHAPSLVGEGVDTFELGHYQYGAMLRVAGVQILECFIGEEAGSVSDFSVRGKVANQGSKVNVRNGSDSYGAILAATGSDRVRVGSDSGTGVPAELRIQNGHAAGYFSFCYGIDEQGAGGTDVLQVSEDGLRIPQRASAPTVASGYTVIWAKTDGTVQKTSNVGGTTTTAQL